jgi:Leucine-rich repeat (LRR) protein
MIIVTAIPSHVFFGRRSTSCRSLKRCLVLVFTMVILCLLSINATSQKKPVKQPVKQTAPKPQPEKIDAATGEKKVKDMLAFLEFMLNTLGSSGTPTRDKEVLITESYSKIFRDSKVQIEDDLDDERRVITNKDVVAYLKDVNFFFKNVRFEFTIDDIKNSTLPSGELFYKVSVRRNLTGTTSDGKPVNNTMPRFIEVNYNPKEQDLKIVSIYTKGFNEKEALTNWWKELSYEWQSIFKSKLKLTDNVQLGDIKNITAIQQMDLSNNPYIQSIDPLAQLLTLRQLDISGTSVSDLTPIRNLTELVELQAANTAITDLQPLKYSSHLEILNLSNTRVNNIAVVERMTNLKKMNLSGTPVTDFAPLVALTGLLEADLSNTKIATLTTCENLTQLTELNIAGTLITDLSPLKTVKNLEVLNVDSTRIKDFSVLSNLENLTVLHANHTLLADLMPLQKLAHLEKIYCDQTPIKRSAALAFSSVRPKVLIIFDSKDLKQWWETLSADWQKVLSKTAGINAAPVKEELAKVTNLDSVSLAGLTIDNLEPLRNLHQLKVVVARNTGITDLSPLQGHKEITHLDISETGVSDISIITQFKKLKVLRADNSKIENIERYTLPSLEKLYADRTAVHDITAREFLEKNPECLLIYKSNRLESWWSSLNENWKTVFRSYLGKNVNRENLHRLVEQPILEIKEVPVNDLMVIQEFIRLQELHFSGTSITTIPPLENIKSLKSLRATRSPLQQIGFISQLTELEELDISDTPVSDLSPLWRLKSIKKLNCAGTQIKKLDALEKLENLEHLDCSNTNVSRLNPLDYLNLKTLRCYNTKVSGRAIQNYMASHPDCNVVYYR